MWIVIDASQQKQLVSCNLLVFLHVRIAEVRQVRPTTRTAAVATAVNRLTSYYGKLQPEPTV